MSATDRTQTGQPHKRVASFSQELLLKKHEYLARGVRGERETTMGNLGTLAVSRGGPETSADPRHLPCKPLHDCAVLYQLPS